MRRRRQVVVRESKRRDENIVVRFKRWQDAMDVGGRFFNLSSV